MKNNDENSLIEFLCLNNDGVVLDAKQIRVHWLRPKIKTLILDGVLKGDAEALLDLLTLENYAENL